jgi:competence ComEA-like helix-hairpin-helix protein
MNGKSKSRYLALAALLLATVIPAPVHAAESKKVVNVNSAELAQLQLLPRVGPSVAQRIVDFRKQNGPFKKAEDLMLVRGIGEKTFQLLRPYVATAGETTLREKVKAGKVGDSKPAREGKDPKPEKEPSR